MKSLLARAGFRDLLVGQAVSAFGDWMVTIALMALVLRLSGSSTAVGGILVLRLLPAVVAGPLAARAAQKWDRRRTMLTMDVARAAIVCVVPIVRALWWVYVWAFVLEVGGLVFLPARDAAIPQLVGDDDLSLANGLVLGSSYGTIPLGAGAFAAVAALSPTGGGFIAHHAFALVFWVDAATFLVSFALIRRIPQLVASAEDVPSDLHGFRAAFGIPLVRQVIVPTMAIALGLGSLFSLGIVYVREILHASYAEFGVLIALFGVGAAGGLALLRADPNADRIALVRLGVAAQGATIALFSAARRVALAFLGAAAFGGATTVALTSGMSVLQEELDGEERTLAFTAFHVVIRAGLAVAAIGAGVAADVVGHVHIPGVGTVPPARLVLVCAGLIVVAGAGLVRRRPMIQR